MEQETKQVPENAEEQNVIRQYLLGTLSDKEKMREIEENLLVDDAFAERLSATENELVEDYIDGQLTESENRRFTKFFLFSEQGKRKLRLTQNLRKYAARSKTPAANENSEKRYGFREWLFMPATVRFAALIILAAGTFFGVWRVFFYQSDADKGLVQLRIAYNGQRTTESRTTANLAYAPLITTRGAELTNPTDEKARKRAERFLSGATENAQDAEAHHRLGLLYLTEKKFDDALKEFNLALSITPNNAGLNSDTGAAYLERAALAQAEGRGDDFYENANSSLKHLNTALEIDGNLAEALFNKALVLQKMQSYNQAREAWEKYLEKDSASPWANEARMNLERLKQQNNVLMDKSQILQDFLDSYRNRKDVKAWEIASQTKELITEVMLAPQLAERFLKADEQNRTEESRKILQAFKYLGKLERQMAQDSFFEELADYYSNTNRAQRQKLLEAQTGMRQGYELLLKNDWKQSFETFQKAKEIFSSAGNIWETQIAEYQICYALCQLKQIKESNERLFVISSLAETKNYKWLQSLSDGWIANNYSLLDEESRALDYGRKSLKTAQEISDTYNAQKISNQLAHQYWLLGDADKTLSNIYYSLNFSNLYYSSPRQKSRNLLIATGGLYRFKFYDAASVLAKEEARVAEDELKDNWLRQTAHNQLATIYAESQKYNQAFHEVETSFQIAQFFPEVMRRKQTTAARLVLANIQRQAGGCGEALGNYNQVIQDYENTDFSINKYAARKGRLLCFADLENDFAVKEEMPVILKMFDENRRTITEESNRITFFDNEQSLYDIAADYAYTRLKDNEQSFNYSENSRSRSLLALIRDEHAQPFLLSEIRAKIPPGVQIIYYAVLTDRLLIWLISDTGFVTAEKKIAADDLAGKIKEFGKVIIQRGELAASAKELYELLIEPLEEFLEKDKALCLIADKSLLRLPFAALISPRTNKYLIEDYSLLYAPSATIFLIETELARQKTRIHKETILSFGNPSFSSKDYPKLADLPSAAREAEKIVEIYDSSKIFTGEKANKAELINNLGEADILHFAGHYVTNIASPLLSRFILAGGDLTIEEISRKRFDRPRLVVLSACETGIESYYRGEGSIGAARAFLALDVPLVVSSQWAVDSKATAKMMIKFHYYRKQEGMSTVKALRAAQIDMLSAGEDLPFRQPYYWAAFLPVGGYTDY